MVDAEQDLIYVRERRLPYETFDADNHLYENQDALTKFLPQGVQGRDQVHRGRRPHEAGDPRPHQRVHPEPDLRAGGGARRLGQHRVEQGGERQERPRRRQAEGDARHRRVLRPRAAPRADEGHGHRPHGAVADAGERARGARRRRPRVRGHGHPRAQRVDARALDATCTATRSTRRRSSASRPGADRALEELAVHPRARRQDLPDARGAGAHLAGPQVVRAAGVRPVLGGGGASRHRRRHALG